MKRVSLKGLGSDLFKGPIKEKSLRQQAGKLGKQQAGKLEFIKAIFYIWPEHDLALEELRLRRLKSGQKADKSALVREAIELLASQHESKEAK